MRLFERAVRRAEIPVRMSQGWNPRPRLSLPAALPLGVCGLDEVLELETEDSASCAGPDLGDRLGRQLPHGIEIREVAAVARGAKAVVEEVEYRVRLSRDCPSPDAIERLLGAAHLVVERETKAGRKPVDLRPWLRELRQCANELVFVARVTSQGAIRPTEILEALGITPDACASPITRQRVTLRREPEAGIA